jgi:hypothetical protein
MEIRTRKGETMSVKITDGKMIELSKEAIERILLDYALSKVGTELASKCSKILYSETEYGVAIAFVNTEEESEARR